MTEGELLALAARTPFAAINRLVALGADRALVARLHGAGDLAAARVHVEAGGARWQPEGAEPRLLLAVREGGGLVDVLALDSRNPDAWALLRGDCWLLGFDLWARVMVAQAGALRLFGTPFDWLRGGGQGVCVLVWDAVSLGMLRGLGGKVLLLVDPAHRVALLDRLRWQGLPEVRDFSGDQLRGAA